MNLKNDRDYLTKLITRHIKGESTEEEKAILNQWMEEDSSRKDLFCQLSESARLIPILVDYNQFGSKKGWESLRAKLEPQSKKIRNFNFKYLFYAASIIAVIGISVFYYRYSNTDKIDPIVEIAEGKVLKDSSGAILPATTGAIIVTSTGERISLDQSFQIDNEGKIITDNEAAVISNEASSEPTYYELIVPKAKIIHFTMYDGTKVWVNANSRLKIPMGSLNSERRISLLSGEAYFEVAKYENQKFIVDTDKGNVEVLGTKFNVNSFGQLFKTTLIEGSVKVKSEFAESILTPNTSAILRDKDFVITKTNLNSDLAWKNNIFYFNNFTIQRIARQIENWYGVKVHIGEEVVKAKSTYSGELRRDVPLTEIRKMLEFISGLDVKIEGENLNIEMQ